MSTIRRMRARAKLYPIYQKNQETPLERPEGMSDDDWKQLQATHDEFVRSVELERTNRFYGRPLPFSRTPRGTMGFPWFQVGGQTNYETDLTPQSDEASVLLITAYRLDKRTQQTLIESNLIKQKPNSEFGLLKIGNDLLIISDWRKCQRIEHEYAIKFWIVSENVSNELSELFHVELPASLDGISCTKLKKKSKQYRLFNKLLEV
jgi:hypothetical protein